LTQSLLFAIYAVVLINRIVDLASYPLVCLSVCLIQAPNSKTKGLWKNPNWRERSQKQEYNHCANFSGKN